jgi:murein DD-endopeptidase MepM/ murein hydrolase activator NlpD
MSLQPLFQELGVLFKRWFHKRNIIIVSENGVKHIPIAGSVQFVAVVAVLGFVCWASYSTGSFMAARDALKEQGKTLRTVASAHVNQAMSASLAPAGAPVQPLAPMMLLGQDKDKMVSRVIYLEHKVNQLQSVNAEIIQRVQEKTDGRIDDLESIIRQTGLDADRLLKAPPRASKSQGGPFIPADMSELRKSSAELFADLDELSRLRQLVMAMPLGMPIRNATPQSSFGHRFDPFTNRLAFHAGLDLAGPAGSKIMTTADGVVTRAEWFGAYGKMVEVDHGNGIATRYGHLSEIRAEKGQRVSRGDVIGIQGSTGRSTGAHLHYEVRFRDEAMNPKKFLEAGRYVSQN